MPYLTVRMAARIQGFDDSWRLFGSKTHAYRQVGNAFHHRGDASRNCDSGGARASAASWWPREHLFKVAREQLHLTLISTGVLCSPNRGHV